MPAAQSPAQDSIHLADADDWDQHWEAFAEAAARNPAQAYRRRLAAKLLEAVGPPIRLVDLGSGQGDFLGMAARRWPDAELLGVEPSRLGIAQSREKAPTARLELIDLLADTEIPDDLRGWATHALCSEVLEHVDDPCSLLASSRALLAPGCRLVVTVPGGPMSAFDRHIGHRRHFTPTALGRILEQAGYQVELALSCPGRRLRASGRALTRTSRCSPECSGSRARMSAGSSWRSSGCRPRPERSTTRSCA